MATTSDPFLPVQTSGMRDAEHDYMDPAQSDAARERRFRYIRLGVLAAAGKTPSTLGRYPPLLHCCVAIAA